MRTLCLLTCSIQQPITYKSFYCKHAINCKRLKPWRYFCPWLWSLCYFGKLTTGCCWYPNPDVYKRSLWTSEASLQEASTLWPAPNYLHAWNAIIRNYLLRFAQVLRCVTSFFILCSSFSLCLWPSFAWYFLQLPSCMVSFIYIGFAFRFYGLEPFLYLVYGTATWRAG